ncbi:MAG: hypothetical protein KKD29_00345 [Candidatus Omnitrophica bacterium]|nr:hypothetical protein [Candidatus Omnitrophota bacterium]
MQLIKKIFKENGLTLIELLVATLIGTLVFMVLFYVSFTIQENINISSGILGITESGRLATSYISNDARQAKLLTSYSSYSTNNTTLVLEIPVANTSGTIIGSDMIVYALDSADPTKLRRIVYATAGSPRSDSNKIVAEDVDTLLFSSYGTGLSSIASPGTVKLLTMKIITKTNAAGVVRVNEIITSASLRNKKISY